MSVVRKLGYGPESELAKSWSRIRVLKNHRSATVLPQHGGNKLYSGNKIGFILAPKRKKLPTQTKNKIIMYVMRQKGKKNPTKGREMM